MANLKVLMMGGRRCGKTSLLSSLFDQMIHTPEIYELLTVSDQTILETKEFEWKGERVREKQESLNDKKLELKQFLRTYKPSAFLVDAGPTLSFWTYKMQIQLAGTDKRMTMEFRDVPGEFFDRGKNDGDEKQNKIHQDNIKAVEEYVKECDVFVIVVDTPYLMHNDDTVVEAACLTDSIHAFITHIDDISAGAKLFLFVPMKCEKWIRKGEIAEVKKCIHKWYAPTIMHLQQRANRVGNTEISIIPVQTAGGIEFSEMRKAYTVTQPSGKIIKCSMVGNKTVLKADGTNYGLQDGDILNEDIDATFNEVIERPYTWFQHTSNPPKYAPKHCEQVALHTLRFMLNKARKNQGTGWFTQFFKRIFGMITIKDLDNTLVKMTNQGLIKDTEDGIERIKIYR